MKKRLPLLVAVLFQATLEAQNTGYVVDNGRGQVEVLDLGTRRVSTVIATGAESSEMLILPNNRLAFVSNQAANHVTALDLSNNQRLGDIPAGILPGSLAATPDGRYLYVANVGSNDVTVIDTAARAVVATIPVGATPVQVNVSPNGRFAFTVNQDETPTGTVSIIDTNRNQVVKTLAVGLRPKQIAISPNPQIAYVVNTGSDNVSVVDLSHNEITGAVEVGQGPVSATFSTDGRWFYVVNRDSNTVSVVDTEENRVVAEIAVGTQPVAMAVTFESRFGYVTNQGSGSISLLDLTTNTAEDTIPVGDGPFSLMLDPNEDFLYVTNLNSGTVSVIDLNTDRVIATIEVGGIPVEFTMRNAPTLLELAPNPAPAGSRITLNGEGFLPTSIVRFVTTVPPRTVAAQATFLDSQGLEVTVPSFPASNPVVSVANPDGNSSEQVTLRAGTAAPFIFPGGMVEGAGFARAPSPISGNSIVSVFGVFQGAADEDALAFPLPTTLGSARVTFNGAPAPLIGVRAAQINLVAPVRLAALESVRVAVTVSGETSAVETVNVAVAAPGIFVISPDGAGAFLHGADNSVVTASSPARRGEILVVFVTGLGDTSPPPIEGEAAPRDVLSPSNLPASVTVAGTPAGISFSGLAPDYSGLYQINFEVPQSTPSGNDAAVSVTIGERTSNTARLAVE